MRGPLPLTERQETLWRFLASCERSPSYFEMRDGTGIRAIAGIQRAINRLEEYGVIARTKHRKRSIEVLQMPDGTAPKKRPPQTLSDWTDEQLIAEIERRKHARDRKNGSTNWMTDARLGSTKLLRALETAGVRP